MANLRVVVLLRPADTATTWQFLALKSSFDNVMDVYSQFFKEGKYSFLLPLFLLTVPPIPLSFVDFTVFSLQELPGNGTSGLQNSLQNCSIVVP